MSLKFEPTEQDERKLQGRIVDKLAELGFDCLCLVLAGQRGWPDLTVFKRGDAKNRVVFLEVKLPSGKVSPQQWHVSEWLHARGQSWFIATSVEDAVTAVQREFRLDEE